MLKAAATLLCFHLEGINVSLADLISLQLLAGNAIICIDCLRGLSQASHPVIKLQPTAINIHYWTSSLVCTALQKTKSRDGPKAAAVIFEVQSCGRRLLGTFRAMKKEARLFTCTTALSTLTEMSGPTGGFLQVNQGCSVASLPLLSCRPGSLLKLLQEV